MFTDKIRQLLDKMSTTWLKQRKPVSGEAAPAGSIKVAKVAAKNPRARIHKPKDPPRPASNM